MRTQYWLTSLGACTGTVWLSNWPFDMTSDVTVDVKQRIKQNKTKVSNVGPPQPMIFVQIAKFDTFRPGINDPKLSYHRVTVITTFVVLYNFPCVCSWFSQWYQWYTNIVQGYTNGTIGNTIGTNGNANGTICSPNCTFGTISQWCRLPMVPLVKLPMVPLGEPEQNPYQTN